VKTPLILLFAGLSLGVAAQGPELAATVTGVVITRDELAAAPEGTAREARLLELIWPRIAGHYVARQGLAATPAEVEEVLAYHREFERRDRAQRARKLEELDRRLTADSLGPEERTWLQEFQATLQRLALYELEQDRMPQQGREHLEAFLARWVEMWKMNRTLYERYGGVVALVEFGPSPHGARAALIADYERLGLLQFADTGLRERVYAMLEHPPSMVVPPGRVEFTPYWKRPIPPSYFPD
jgi:hypothetical protein